MGRYMVCSESDRGKYFYLFVDQILVGTGVEILDEQCHLARKGYIVHPDAIFAFETDAVGSETEFLSDDFGEGQVFSTKCFMED